MAKLAVPVSVPLHKADDNIGEEITGKQIDRVSVFIDLKILLVIKKKLYKYR